MVGIVSGHSLGLDATSAATLAERGRLGESALGQSGERSWVNVATGNLVVQDVDAFVASQGLDLTALRTYNSQGLMDDDNGDNWSNGFYARQLQFAGDAGSRGDLTRTAADGSRAVYRFDAEHTAQACRPTYVSTAGAGAYDTIVYSDSTFTWTDGASGASETYTVHGANTARLASATDHRGGATRYTYDANGYLTAVRDSTLGANDRDFVNDANGRVLYARQGTHVQRQLIVNGEVLGRYGETVNDKEARNADGSPVFTTSANFNFGYEAAGGDTPDTAVRLHTVGAGDTLESIARGSYGDSRLWYHIAEANGMTGNADLKAGQLIRIPGAQTGANNADTFRPYQPVEIVGDTSPNMPMPPRKKPSFLAQLLTLVISIIAANVLGAIPGSIISQHVAIATGVQEEFSWKQVGMAAVSAWATQNLGSIGLAVQTASPGFDAVANAAIANTLTQGIGVATGMQEKFSWQSVAASAVGAGVGQAVGSALGMNNPGFRKLSFGEQLGTRLVTSLAAGSAAAIARGGRTTVQQIALDAFGNALGYSVMDAMRTDPTEIPLTQDQRDAMAMGSGPLNPSAAARAMMLTRYDLRSNFAPTGEADEFEPIGGAEPGLSVTDAGMAMSPEALRKQEIGDRNLADTITGPVQDADMHKRGPRASAGDVACYRDLESEMTGWPVDKIFRANDPNHYVLAAFKDGTWNKRPGDDLLDIRPGNDYTNVGLTHLLSRNQSANFRAEYFSGVGTDWYTKHFSGATGFGVTLRAEAAYRWISDNVNEIRAGNSSATFSFLAVGFSRGSLEARMLLRMLDERGIPDYTSKYEVMTGEANSLVRYERNIIAPRESNLNAVLFDTVTTGAGDFYNVDLPARAQVYHVIARDEMRTLFPSAPLARVGQAMSPSWFERVVAGDHSDIGNNHDRGGIGDMNLKLAHQFMTQKLGLPMMPIPTAYTPAPETMWIHDMRGEGGAAPLSNSPFVRPLAPRYQPLQPIPTPYR